MYIHHAVSVVNFYGTLVFMNFTVTFGVLMLFTEISTIFICLRWFLYTHGYGHSCFAMVNTIIVFFAFLLCRVTFQVFAVFGYGLPLLVQQFKSETMNWWQVTLMLEMAAAILASVLLNAFWMGLIIHQVVRMVNR
jgi:hypothetical protein